MSAASAQRYQIVEAGRGLACLAVLLFHSLSAFQPSGLTPGLGELRSLTQWGGLGVHVFFALSGWCIAERLVQARTRGESVGSFLRERAFRIFPVYWIAVLLALALRLAAIPFNHQELATNLPSGWLGWLGTFLLIDPYIGTHPYLLVSWSLVYEIGFYICAGVALGAAQKFQLSARTLLWIGTLVCLVPWLLPPNICPWIVLGLWPDFFTGVAAWYAVRRRQHLAGCGVLLALAGATFLFPVPGTSGRLTAVATALLLVALAPWDRPLSTRRPVRGLLWLGGISYSLYLIPRPTAFPVAQLLRPLRFVD